MQAELKIAGLDEIIKSTVEEAVKNAVEKVVKPVLREFKSEVVAAKYDELLQKPIWTKKDIMAFTDRSKAWVDRLPKRYEDFPKKKTQNDNDKAYWDRDEILTFFVRHPEIPTTAEKYVKERK